MLFEQVVEFNFNSMSWVGWLSFIINQHMHGEVQICAQLINWTTNIIRMECYLSPETECTIEQVTSATFCGCSPTNKLP